MKGRRKGKGEKERKHGWRGAGHRLGDGRFLWNRVSVGFEEEKEAEGKEGREREKESFAGDQSSGL